MNQSIEVIHTSSWDDRFGKEIVSIDTCPAKPNRALIVSLHHLAICDFTQTVQQEISFDDNIVAASLHPSGNHVIIGFPNNLVLANVLENQIQVFCEMKSRKLVTCRFNPAGTLYATLSSNIIEVFDFNSGARINSIECKDTSVSSITWGTNCRLFVVCGTSIREYNAITGEAIRDYSTDGRILDCTVTTSRNVLVTSGNKISVLDSDLKPQRDIIVGNGLEITGPIAVSHDSVFVAVSGHDDNAVALQIFTLEGQEQYYKAVIGAGSNVLEVNNDGRVLLTNEGMFVVKDDRRLKSSMITALSEQTEESVYEQISDVFVSSRHIEDQKALLRDAKSRLADLEMMIALESKTIKDAQSSRIIEKQETQAYELRNARLQLELLKQEEAVTRKNYSHAIEDAKFKYANELEHEMKINRDRLLKQVR